jgi:hypothetical protein
MNQSAEQQFFNSSLAIRQVQPAGRRRSQQKPCGIWRDAGALRNGGLWRQ